MTPEERAALHRKYADPIEMGATLKAAPKNEVRHLSRLFCPHDQRQLAAVVVYRGDVLLWRSGARLGNHAANLEEIDTILEWQHEDLAKCSTDEELAELQASIASTESIRQIMVDAKAPALLPSEAFPLENPRWRKRRDMRCPGCRRRYYFSVTDDDTLQFEE